MLKENPAPMIGTEPLSDFANRNNYYAEFPKLSTYKDKKAIPFCPITTYNDSEDWAGMLAEAESLRDYYVPHRTYDGHDGWESLCVHGLSSVHVGSNANFGYENFCPENKWTDVSFFTPKIKDFIMRFNFPIMARVRIMKLKAGGFVTVHHDGHYGIGAINIALNNPVNCNFYLDGFGILPFHNRDREDFPRLILPNIGYYHAVVNNSGEDRYHIIVHAEKTRDWERIENAAIA